MPRSDFEIRIAPSVLDRLLDDDPDLTQEAPSSRSKSLRELKDSVRRDIEWLLNTRQTVGGAPDGLIELGRSLAAYGLPDFSNITVSSPADQLRLQRSIETVISNFEPRLQNVLVTLLPSTVPEQKLRFRIEGRLRIEPAPEPVAFDTVLRADNSQYVVNAE